MLNNICLMGRLTKDPELRTVKDDVKVANFTLAVDRPKYGQNEKKTDFIPIVAWRKTAEFVSKWYKKGALIYVIGRLTTRSWDDENGQKRFAFDIEISDTGFAESRKDKDGHTHTENGSDIPDNFMPDFSGDDDLPF